MENNNNNTTANNFPGHPNQQNPAQQQQETPGGEINLKHIFNKYFFQKYLFPKTDKKKLLLVLYNIAHHHEMLREFLKKI